MLYAVYGSLKKGFGNHILLKDTECVFEGFVEIPYTMISLGGFPGLLRSGQKNKIYIEVYKVEDDETERNLDRLEGYPSFYDKEAVETPVGEAMIYFLHRDRYGEEDVVEDGNWTRARYVY
jgi:gamma-glutamylaminecyclotransferase